MSIELPRLVFSATDPSVTNIGCEETQNGTIVWSAGEHDIDFNVQVTPDPGHGNAQITSRETWENDARVLSILYTGGGQSTIVIQGTHIVPEFGASSVQNFVMAVGVAGIVLAGLYLRRRFV